MEQPARTPARGVAVAGVVRRLGVAKRFFARHTAAELARPLTAVRRAEECLSDIAPAARNAPALVIDPGGAMLGALGPRQIRVGLRTSKARRCAEAMVPVQSLTVVPGSAPANVLLGGLNQNGFAMVRGRACFLVAEADDVDRQIRLWLLEKCGRRRATESRERPDSSVDETRGHPSSLTDS